MLYILYYNIYLVCRDEKLFKNHKYLSVHARYSADDIALLYSRLLNVFYASTIKKLVRKRMRVKRAVDIIAITRHNISINV